MTLPGLGQKGLSGSHKDTYNLVTGGSETVKTFTTLGWETIILGQIMRGQIPPFPFFPYSLSSLHT